MVLWSFDAISSLFNVSNLSNIKWSPCYSIWKYTGSGTSLRFSSSVTLECVEAEDDMDNMGINAGLFTQLHSVRLHIHMHAVARDPQKAEWE